MIRLSAALAATSLLAITVPATAQSMQGMNMPGMKMPMPAKKRAAAKPAAKGKKPAKKRTNLSVYWQWVIYTYGPQLLGTLGTFRFLLTELVPLQLIVWDGARYREVTANPPERRFNIKLKDLKK